VAEVIARSPEDGTRPADDEFGGNFVARIFVTKTHLPAWSALMAVLGVVLMLGASVASGAPTARAMDDPTPSARVTVTVTPTILVSKNANGELITVGTVTPGAKPAATTEAGSGGFLGWIFVGLVLVVAAGAAYWWLLRRRSTAHIGRRRAGVKPEPDTHPQERLEL
jgi:hypothetical protein